MDSSIKESSELSRDSSIKESSELSRDSSIKESLIGQIKTFDGVLSNDDFNCLKDYTDKLNFDTPSFVFNRQTETLIKDTDVRSSKTVIINDKALREFIDKKLLDKIRSQGYVINIARNHLTFIRYDVGDFFDWHQDFEKYVINDRYKWVEMHMLFCLQAPIKGGELEIKLFNDDMQTIAMNVNRAIIFDKYLEHKGTTVIEGTKLILTVDILISQTEILNSTILDYHILNNLRNMNDGLYQVVGTYNYKLFKKLPSYLNSDDT